MWALLRVVLDPSVLLLAAAHDQPPGARAVGTGQRIVLVPTGLGLLLAGLF
jgi:hypothetical protein